MASFEPIGTVECPQRYRYEAPRQGVLIPENRAVVRLSPERGFERALEGLEGFERIWLLFELHLNETWHPRVRPPRAGAPLRGVFATRSPHRPNRIGLTCVRLLAIDGLSLTVAGHDLLDGTPVLDIKPYVPYADAFPAAAAGWLDAEREEVYDVTFVPEAAQRIAWLREGYGLDPENFARVQLRVHPTDGSRKRITPADGPGRYVIAYRTWRLDYEVADDPPAVRVTRLRSGYAPADLAPGTPDSHGDKDVHRAYADRFPEIDAG